jgi:hypothetical protein
MVAHHGATTIAHTGVAAMALRLGLAHGGAATMSAHIGSGVSTTVVVGRTATITAQKSPLRDFAAGFI